jgi:hypothetical protein
MLEKEVTTLVSGEKSACSYSLKFDGSKLLSGIYFYKIETNGFSQTKK